MLQKYIYRFLCFFIILVTPITLLAQTKAEKNAIKKELKAIKKMKPVDIRKMKISLEEQLEDKDVEIHLDINPDIKHNSSIVIQQAVGYIKGTCNVTPMVKPQAFAATYCADRLKEILAYQQAA